MEEEFRMNGIASVSSDGRSDQRSGPISGEGLSVMTFGNSGAASLVASSLREAVFVAGFGALPAAGNGSARDVSFGAGILSVVDEDDRTKIPTPSLYPWRMICHLEITGSNNARASGTGWLAGEKAVVTAAHCVFHDEIGGWAKEIAVTPGLDGGGGNHGSQVSLLYECPSAWVQQIDPDYDFAVIALDSPFENDPGHFPFASLPDEKLQDQLVNVCGYPYDKDNGTRLWNHRDKILMLEESRIHYHVDTEKGQSGAPVLLFPNGLYRDPVVVAIHSYGISGQAKFNSAPRINAAVFEALNRWISKT